MCTDFLRRRFAAVGFSECKHISSSVSQQDRQKHTLDSITISLLVQVCKLYSRETSVSQPHLVRSGY